MLPRLQIDEQITDIYNFSSLFITDANRLIWLNLEDVKAYRPNNYQAKQLNQKRFPPYLAKQQLNSIEILKSFEVFPQNDIRNFLIKDSIFVSMAE